MTSTVFERNAPEPSVIDAALASTKQGVFWIDDVEHLRPAHPALRQDVVADLVIVGGGYHGLWTAVRALERNPARRVVLLEAGRIGDQASGRNGGFCDASLTHGAENGRRRWPDEIETLDRLGLENLDQIESTIAKYGMDCDFERTGVLVVATEPHQVEWYAEEHHGLDETAVRTQVNSPSYLGGVWEKGNCALVHPAKLALELARVAVNLGATLYEGTQVTGIAHEGDRIRVTTTGAEALAERVVLATNVFPSLLLRNRLRTLPVYDYVLMTEPLSAEQLASIGWQNRQGLSDSANQFHYYRLSSDNRILFGGYDAIYHAGGRIRPAYEDRAATFRKLASHFFTTFPQLAGLSFTHKWAGVIDTSTRFCAFFGTAMRGRVAYASGFTGLGVGATRFAADVSLDLVDGLDNVRTRLRMVRERPFPFPPEPLATIAVAVTRWSLDRADHNEGRRNWILRILDALKLGFDS